MDGTVIGVRWAAVLGALVAGVIGSAAIATPTWAAPGFTVRFTELPDRFVADGRPVTVAAVVSTDQAGDCRKVRWSLVLEVRGLRLDQVRIDRFEDTGSFPVEIRVEGAAARLTDVPLDPGILCLGRTVTARYAMAISEPVVRGQIALTAEAYTANGTLLARQTVTRPVIGRASPRPAVTPPTVAPTPTAPSEPSESPPTSAPAVAPSPPQTTAPGDATAAFAPTVDRRDTGVALVGFGIGSLLVFVGASMLLRTVRSLRRIGRAARGSPWP